MPESESATDHRRLAGLVVEALEVGTRKVDRLAGELCAAFDIDLDAIVDPRDYSKKSREATRTTVTDLLVDPSASAEALVEVFARLGGAVIGMVDEIYAILAARAATVGEPAEAFRFRMAGTDLDITISPAFIEQARRLIRRARRVELGKVDDDQLAQLVLYDLGESYGSYPPDADDARPLLHEIMVLRPVRDRLAARAEHTPAFVEAVSRCDEALQSADRLLVRMERLLVGAGAAILAGDLRGSPKEDHDLAEARERDRSREAVEREILRMFGLFGAPAEPRYFEELDAPAFMATRVANDSLEPTEPVPERRADLLDRWGYGLSYLGAYVAIVRSGLTLREHHWTRDKERVRLSEIIMAPTPDAAVAWLRDVTAAADDARAWIDAVWRATGTTDIDITVEEMEELLNLPLWRQRNVLFEIWVLCHTIATCERIGWRAVFHGMVDGTWTLPRRPSTEPVATLHNQGLDLWVWREPHRGVTPDVSVSTTDLACRDLVVVEAKDRFKLGTGLSGDRDEPPKPETALAVAAKYVAKMRPSVTWVCNHSPFGGAAADPRMNEGSVWHRIHLADRFGPGHVPPSFAESIRAALVPHGFGKVSEDRRSEVIFVVDTTSSMRNALGDVTGILNGMAPDLFTFYTAILYGDHDDEYVVRPVAAHPSPAQLAAAIAREPTTHGQDVPEALEDAMHHAAWRAEGPHQVFVVATDAPPHSPTKCPDRLDFRTETANVLATGASILVITDWYPEEPAEWKPFATHPQFAFATIADLTSHLNRLGARRPAR